MLQRALLSEPRASPRSSCIDWAVATLRKKSGTSHASPVCSSPAEARQLCSHAVFFFPSPSDLKSVFWETREGPRSKSHREQMQASLFCRGNPQGPLSTCGCRGNPAQPNEKKEMESLPHQLLRSGRKKSPHFLVSARFCFCSEPNLMSRQSQLPCPQGALPGSTDGLGSCCRLYPFSHWHPLEPNSLRQCWK